MIQPLTRHADDRGYFEEIIRVDDTFFAEGFGQWSHSKMFPGIIKAWHIHKTQIDWWYVAAVVCASRSRHATGFANT